MIKTLEENGIGGYTYICDPVKVERYDDNARLIIGKYCSISKNCTFILGGNHHKEWITTFPLVKEHRVCKGDIVIGNDVWIGYGVTILSGVEIGDGAIIGANSLVCKDVRPYFIVGGNPIQEISTRFSPYETQQIRETKWWDWPHDTVKKMAPILSSGNIKMFLYCAEKINSGMIISTEEYEVPTGEGERV